MDLEVTVYDDDHNFSNKEHVAEWIAEWANDMCSRYSDLADAMKNWGVGEMETVVGFYLAQPGNSPEALIEELQDEYYHFQPGEVELIKQVIEAL